MDSKILLAIEESLPSIQAKELQAFFLRYEEMELKVADLTKRVDTKQEKIYELEVLKLDKEINDKKKISLNKFEKDIEDKIYKYDLKKITHELEAEKASNIKYVSLVDTIFRNKYVTKNIMSNWTEATESNWGFISSNIIETISEI